ncbi:MAG: pantoate--beta-alanine ligase [Paludibacteraceae bacterium]|jgi:pantoate--beta-alanine ligase|nr:pantoate--beta-alanine ligase [Paludibacteraceae bacterium]MBO5989614.1 pantoate--beta-alanine ligase [Paludibacteraceae bacterium]MEE0996772.1 pantoate--beta-alanine ligase [Paludibacteraceae bacterium]
MKVIEKTFEVTGAVSLLESQGKTVGFVPTMGALHEGHLTLVRRCAAENDVCVVSIFVNPTQFNNKHDLETYPRNLEADIKLLQSAGCDVLFAPSESEIYPEPDTRRFDFGTLDKVMEGAYRPGHFNGVAQVVSRLFNIIKPTRAYFGEKDFQQLAIIREMVKQYNVPVEIVGCPIAREESGLALSSRNQRLSAEGKAAALSISKALFGSVYLKNEKSVSELKAWVIDKINSDPMLEVEYFDIVDALSLESIENWDETDNAVGCVTVYCGDVRLIDNIQYGKFN